MKDVFIVDAIRTAIGNFGGTLAPIRTDDLGASSLLYFGSSQHNVKRWTLKWFTCFAGTYLLVLRLELSNPSNRPGCLYEWKAYNVWVQISHVSG